MAGVHIRIETEGTDAITRALRRLIDASAEPDDMLREIGEYLLTSHKERFAAEQSPDGTPWLPLSAEYAARKSRKRPGRPILVFDDLLRGGLRYDVAGGEERFLGTATGFIQGHALQAIAHEIDAPGELGIRVSIEPM